MWGRMLAPALALLLAGCGSLKFWDDDESDPTAPAPLPSLEKEEIRIQRLWSRDLGAGPDGLRALLRPAVAQGRVLGADPKGRVVALDAVRGKVLWRTDLDRELSGGVGVGGGLALVANLEGRVFALELDSGRLRWQVRIDREVLGPPASDGEIVAVQSSDGHLLALDAQNGQERWRHRVDVPSLNLRLPLGPEIVGGLVLAGFASGKVVALGTGGDLRWEARVAIPRGRTELERMVDIVGLQVADDIVYATAYQGRTAAFTLGSGRALWYQDLAGHQPPALGGGKLFIVRGDDEVVALDAATGRQQWSNVQLRNRRLSAPAWLEGGLLAIGDLEGYLHVLDAADGRYLGRVRVARDPLAVPLVAEGSRVYALREDGKLTAYEVRRRVAR
ncbi:MAG: outer membrane protein assembly factor BamB [Porticoccaceae bacterium]|nr:MAG: outer membrane protein assembly factor BamB [Porticoccaceae bacterium]